MKTLLLAFLLCLFCGNVLACDEGVFTETIRRALIERLLAGDAARLEEETPVDVKFVRQIASRRLGTNMTASATKITGANFKFVPLGYDSQRLLHVGVWVFSYRNSKMALRNAKNVKRISGNMFKAKVLTVFSSTLIGNRLIIVFTENAGDEGVVSFVKSAPGFFGKYSNFISNGCAPPNRKNANGR
ncbi:MAG: hypothetical protein LBG78_02410 [Azoarcus sp.]|jgi:hypothetical protein|nr:hypothetical protein [Azoarcus sp.]